MNTCTESRQTNGGNRICKKDRHSVKMDLWDVLNEYADVRDAFDDMSYLVDSILDDLRITAIDISDELDDMRERLEACDRVFRRFPVMDGAAQAFIQPYRESEGNSNENSI